MRLIAVGILAMATTLLAAPKPIAPVDDVSTLHAHPHFRWTQAYQPKAVAMPEYEVEIATDSSFTNVIDKDHVAAVITRYVPAKPLTPGRYWWRVRGRDATGKQTQWSEPGRFTVALPTKILNVPARSTFKQIQAIFKSAASQAPARIVFTKGEYRLNPGKATGFIQFDGAHDLVIDGNGAALVFTDKTSFVALKNCSNIHITGFTIDYATMPHTAGKVVAVDRRSQTIDLELLPGFPRFEDDKRIAQATGGMVRNADDLAMKNGQPLVVDTEGSFKHLNGRTYRLKARSKNDFAAFAVGDLYIKGPRGPAGYTILNSPDIALTNCTMYMCTGIGFATTGAHRLRIIKCNLQRKEGRPIAVENGGHNHHDGRIGPWVENCLFENTGDDICHVSCLIMGVKEKRSPTQIELWGNKDVKIGDRLQFYEKNGGKLISERRVVSVKPSKRTMSITLDGDVGPIRPDPKTGGRKDYSGTQVFNAAIQCNQFVWRNNICRRGRRIGVLCKGLGGLIENNLFEKQGGGAVEIWNAPYEGLYADGYVIRNNKMFECGLVGVRGDSRTFWMFNRYGSDILHRNILFENNVIRDYPCRAMILRHAQDIVIRGNRISNAKFKTFRNTAGVVDLDGCTRPTFTGNTIQDCRPMPGGAVQTSRCTGLVKD